MVGMRSLKIVYGYARLITMIVAIAFILLSPLVHADGPTMGTWSGVTADGDYTFVYDEMGPPVPSYNLTGIIWKMRCLELEPVKHGWWSFSEDKAVEFHFSFWDATNLSDSITLHVKINALLWNFGTASGMKVHATWRRSEYLSDFNYNYFFNKTIQRSFGAMYLVEDSEDEFFIDDSVQIDVMKLNSTCVRVQVFRLKADATLVLLIGADIPVRDGFFDIVHDSVQIEARGHGNYHVTVYQETIATGEGSIGGETYTTDRTHYQWWDWFGQTVSFVGKVIAEKMPTWLRDSLSGWTELLGSLDPVYNVFISLLPTLVALAPFVIFMYFFDIFCTSIDQGSFVPIGAFVTTAWSAVTAFAGLIVSVASATWDFVHFW